MDSNTLQISSDAPENPGQDLEILRNQGIARLQQFAPDTWTDHNRFDPGITMLEVLAFVLSDLSYKLDFPIQDLLSVSQANPAPPTQFLMPEQVMFTHSVTADDYRRMFLDIPAIKNVHIHMAQDLAGRTIPRFNLNVLLYDPDPEQYNAVRETIREMFLKSRCVNHQLGEITFYDTQSVWFNMDITLNSPDSVVDAIVEIFHKISQEISPDIPRYTLLELLATGMTLDEIYQGPALCNGLIKQEDLARSEKKTHLYSSDILSVLNGHAGIEKVEKFQFAVAEGARKRAGYENWQIVVDDGKQPVLGYDEESFFDKLNILINKQQYVLSDTEKAEIRAGLAALNQAILPAEMNYANPALQGTHRDISQYSSLQNDLPAMYAVGERSLNRTIDSVEKVRLMQYKGYLHLYDQLLADQHKQLDILPYLLAQPEVQEFEHLGRLLDKMLASESISAAEKAAFWQATKKIPRTQLSQPVTDISGVNHLIGNHVDGYQDRGIQDSLEPHFTVRQLIRLNQATEHLLARFSIHLPNPNLMKYKDVFAFYAEGMADMEQDECSSESLLQRLVLLRTWVDKCRFLCEMQSLGQDRCRGFDYMSRHLKRGQLSGQGKRIMRQLGFSHPGQIPMATHNRESFYLVESQLLLGENEQKSNRILYYVLPSWPTRFANDEYRSLVSEQINTLSPLNNATECLWLARETMSLFERLYYAWMNFYGQFQREFYTDSPTSVQVLVDRLRRLVNHFLVKPDTHGEDTLAVLIIEDVQKGMEDWDTVKTNMLAILNAYITADEFEPITELAGDDLASITKDVQKIIDSNEESFPETFSASTVLYLTAQQYIDLICKPTLQSEADRNRRFTISYRPLDYLKPLFPVSVSTINPEPAEVSTFIVATSTPNQI